MALELVDDLRYSILELNAHAMQRSQSGQLAEAQQLLETAYIRLQSADAAVLAADAGLVDQLKATTLSNLGVVECHKKELDKSLDHLEAALAIEKRIGIFSPTTALNLCATFNALGRYEEAVDICTGAINTLMNTNGGKPTDENKTLWAAAWHNLSVAEMNLGGDIGGPEDRRVAVLNMFKNAMRASIDLLGPKHPLTATIHDSYRAARPTLKKQGAYKLRDPLLPMLSTSANNDTLNKRRALHSQYLTDDEKLGSAPAYEGALAGNTGRTNINKDTSRRVPSLLTAVRNAQRGEHGFRPTQTLVRAQPLYLGHHPATAAAPRQSELLLQPRQREMRQQKIPSIGNSLNMSTSNRGNRQQHLANTSRTSPRKSQRQTSPQQQQYSKSARANGQFGSNTSKVLSSLTNNNNNQNDQFSPSSGGVNWNATNASANNNKRSNVEQALIGDMWVEVDIPMARNNNRNSPLQQQGGSYGGGAPALRQAGGSPGGASSYNPSSGMWSNNNNNNYYANVYGQTSTGNNNNGEFRAPSYGQAMHVIEPSDPIMERVTQPSSYAALDSGSGGMVLMSNPNTTMMMNQQQQQRGMVVAPHPQNQQQQQVTSLPPINTNHNQNQQQQSLHQESGIPNNNATAPSLAQQPNVFSNNNNVRDSPTGGAPIPQPPKRPPSGNNATRGAGLPPPAARPGSANNNNNQNQQMMRTPQGQQQQGFNYLADALGSDIKEYPGLAMLSTM